MVRVQYDVEVTMSRLGIALIAFFPIVLLVPLGAWALWLNGLGTLPSLVVWSHGVLITLGMLGTLYGAVLAWSMSDPERLKNGNDPSKKARMLAQGMSESMNFAGVVTLYAFAVTLWMLFATWMWHWHA
jgi:hypothetical protein